MSLGKAGCVHSGGVLKNFGAAFNFGGVNTQLKTSDGFSKPKKFEDTKTQTKQEILFQTEKTEPPKKLNSKELRTKHIPIKNRITIIYLISLFITLLKQNYIFFLVKMTPANIFIEEKYLKKY